MAPEWVYNDPERAQIGRKINHKMIPKMNPEWSQDDPKITPRWPQNDPIMNP